MNICYEDAIYNDRVSLARPLGRALLGCFERECFTAECLAAVPLHRNRERRRGYNQASFLGEPLDLRMEPDIIRLRKNTESQTGLSHAQRMGNVRGAFECRRRIKGSVLIVDDVQTTGATINEIARVLKRAGASRVEVITVPRAHEQGSMTSDEVREEGDF
jgi:ComF family protein